MLISPVQMLQYIKNTDPSSDGTIPKKDIQPNAIDFDIATVAVVDNSLGYVLADGTKNLPRPELETPTMCSVVKSDGTLSDAKRGWWIDPGVVYDCSSHMFVSIPDGTAGELIIRSTLNRLGLTLNAGLYDTGYEGHIGFTLYNRGQNPVFLEVGTKVGQIKMIASQSNGKYAGGYNHAEGTTYWGGVK